MSLSDCNADCDQTIELAEDPDAQVEYPVRVAKFNGAFKCTRHA